MVWCRQEEGRMSLEFFVSNTWFKCEEKRKVTFRMGGNEECVNTKRTSSAYTKCEGNPYGVLTYISDGRYR